MKPNFQKIYRFYETKISLFFILIIISITYTFVTLFSTFKPNFKVNTRRDIHSAKIHSLDLIRKQNKISILSPSEMESDLESSRFNRLNISQLSFTNGNGNSINRTFFDPNSSWSYQVVNGLDSSGNYTGNSYLRVYDRDFNPERLIHISKSNELYSLKKEYLLQDSIRFYFPGLIESDIDIEKYGLGYRLIMSKDLFKRIAEFPHINRDDKKYIFKLSDLIHRETGKWISPKNILKVLQFFEMKNFWSDKLNCNMKFNVSDLHEGVVVGRLKSVSIPGDKLVLIHLKAGKYINDKLICVNIESQKVEWQQSFKKNISQAEIHDIDSDGNSDIIISQNSFSNIPDQNYFAEYESPGKLNFAELKVLDSSGKLKRINGIDCKFRLNSSQNPALSPIFKYLSRKNILITGNRNLSERSEYSDSLIFINLNNNKLFKTAAQYFSLKLISNYKGNFSIYENINGDLVRKEFIPKLLNNGVKADPISESISNSFFENGNRLLSKSPFILHQVIFKIFFFIFRDTILKFSNFYDSIPFIGFTFTYSTNSAPL